MKIIIRLMLAFIFMGAISSTPAHARRIVREWNHGRWVHDRHNGRLGWWWVVGPAWYFYERPHSFVVIQPAPIPTQTIIVQQQPASPPVSPVIYYCKATGTNYPETITCPGGWSVMTAETPPQP